MNANAITNHMVLHVLDYTDPGGGETSLLALIAEAQRQTPRLRHAAIVRGPGPVVDALHQLGVETFCVSYPCRLRRGPIPWYSTAAAGNVERIVKRLAPSVIHANNFFAMLYAGMAARRQRLPLVWTCHGPFDIDRPAKRWAARMFATHVSCVSEAVRAEVQRTLGDPERTSVDYLGIVPFDSGANGNPSSALLRQTIRDEFELADATPLVAVVGRFQPIKGHRLLLEALPQVWSRVPDLQIWLIGDALFGSPEEAAEKAWIEQQIRENGWGNRVRMLGFRADARRLLRGLDTLIVPSRYESFSMACVEALEAGIAVVAPNIGGPREIVDVPSTGLLFEPGSAPDLADKIADVLLGTGHGAGFDVNAGPRRITEHFTAAAHWKRTLALYKRLDVHLESALATR